MINGKNIDSIEALGLLADGNRRFISGLRSIESISTLSKLRELAENGQKPFAIILTCSDSRVPAELIFDRGVGDLFVIRVAGNVVSPSVIGSIEFAASSFGTSLVVVMGHSQCGAVKAAIQSEIEDKEEASNVGKIVKKVRPSVRTAAKALGQAPHELEFKELLHSATLANVRRSASLITKKSPILQKLVDKKQLLVVGAHYDLYTGEAEFDVPGDVLPGHETTAQSLSALWRRAGAQEALVEKRK